MRLLLPIALAVIVVGVTAVTLREPAIGSARPVAAEKTRERAVQPPPADPTPTVAGYRGLEMHLPVPAKTLTAIAFHQASFSNAQHMTTLWAGKSYKLYRTQRSGKPDSAIDVGALPGTPVLAPVTGTVVEVRPYKLYNKYDDVQIHIRPDGWMYLEAVVIHISDVTVKAGDRVTGGVTPMAKVRKLSDRMGLQLADYSKDGGDHTHVQLNAWPATATPTPVAAP